MHQHRVQVDQGGAGSAGHGVVADVHVQVFHHARKGCHHANPRQVELLPVQVGSGGFPARLGVGDRDIGQQALLL